MSKRSPTQRQSAFHRPIRKDMSVVFRNSGQIDPLLHDLLTQPTPYKSEKLMLPFIAKVVKTRSAYKNWKQFVHDGLGNYIVSVGARKKHQTMFSCHMDTVQRGTAKTVLLMTKDFYVYAEQDGKPSVLGADDKIGMYICLKMIQAEVPGLYVFHVGEERGGIGSEALSTNSHFLPGWKAMQRCVAFDRKGFTSIITHQQGTRCCSDKFADAIAIQLNEHFPPFNQFKRDRTGVFTDSANYTDVIGECINLSVGYEDQHSTNEHFDLVYLEKMLIPAFIKVSWSELPSERKPGDVEKPAPTKHYLNHVTPLNRKNGTQVGFVPNSGINTLKRETLDTFPWEDMTWNSHVQTVPLFDFASLRLPFQCPLEKRKIYIHSLVKHFGDWRLAEQLVRHFDNVDSHIKSLEAEILELKQQKPSLILPPTTAAAALDLLEMIKEDVYTPLIEAADNLHLLLDMEKDTDVADQDEPEPPTPVDIDDNSIRD